MQTSARTFSRRGADSGIFAVAAHTDCRCAEVGLSIDFMALPSTLGKCEK
jgi:hypothetical protein